MKKLLVLSCVMAMVASVGAGVITFSDALALQRTNFNKDMSIPQFDPSLGSLQSVKLTFIGDLCGKAKYENGNNYAVSGYATFSLNQSLYEIKKSDNTTMLSLTNNVAGYQVNITNLPAFDGSYDFGGTSGATIDFGCTQDTQVYNFNSVADLAYFTGMGNILWNVQAAATSASTSDISGLVRLSESLAGASVVVEYTYIPEPATMALLALGGLLLRRKK